MLLAHAVGTWIAAHMKGEVELRGQEHIATRYPRSVSPGSSVLLNPIENAVSVKSTT